MKTSNRISAATQAVSRITAPAYRVLKKICPCLPRPPRSGFAHNGFLIGLVLVTSCVVSEASAQTISTGMLVLSTSSVTENSGTTVVTVTATPARPGTTSVLAGTVRLTVTGGTATEGMDFDAVSPITFTIPSSTASSTGTFELTVTDDTVEEEDETLTVSGTINFGTGVGNLVYNPVTLTITDNDGPPTAIALSLNPTSVLENSGTTSVMVTAAFSGSSATLSTATDVTVSVAAGTATAAGTDFADVTDFMVTIPANMASGTASFDLVVTDDTLAEGPENVTVSGSTAAVGFTAIPDATLTITDNDGPPTAIALSLNPTSVLENSGTTSVAVTAAFSGSSATLSTATDVTVSVAAGTATAAGTDFADVTDFMVTIPANMASGTASFDLVVTDDTLAEGPENVTVSGSTAAVGFTAIPDATLTITDNEMAPTGITLALSSASVTEGSGTTTVTVTAAFSGSSATLANATAVAVTVAGGTATGAGTDFADVTGFTVTILANMASGTATFDLVVTDDTMGEGDETLVVSGTASGFAIPDATLTITDDDPTGITLSLDPASVSEDSGTTTVAVTASLFPEGSLVATATAVAVTVAGGTAAGAATGAGTDFADITGFTVTIPASMASGMATFDLVVTDDMLSEGDETLTVSGTATGLTDASAMLTITDDDEAAATQLNEQILTRAAQVMTAGTLAAVGARVDAVAGGRGGSGKPLAYQLGGQSSLRGLLETHGKAMLEDTMDYQGLLEGASFVLPLAAADGDSTGTPGALAFWGGFDSRTLAGEEDTLDWDGKVSGFHLGIDRQFSEKLMAGVALSSNRSSFDYKDTVTTAAGEYRYNSVNLHPYFGWYPSDALRLWGTLGYGSGEIKMETDIETDAVQATDSTQLSLSGGFSRQVLSSTDLLSGGATTLNLKGDVSMTSVDVEEKADFAAQKVGSTRLRVLVSGEQQRGLASGGRLMPSVEVGVRFDGGDGVTGAGVELGGGLRYANPGGNLSVAGNVRTLLAGGYDEFGVDFTVQLVPGSGRGLSLTLHPVWGKTGSAAERLWNDGASEITGGDTALVGSVDTEVGYGVAATMLGSPGVLTPYTGMTAQDGGSSRLRLGGRFVGGNGLSLNLEGVRGNTADGASHQVLLRGEVSF